jgi:cytidylate kinase
MSVVTISGQTGSGAREVGRLAAERLHLDYVDQEILVEAARALGVPMESVVSHDERTASLGERLAAMLRRFLESSATAGAADPMLGSGGLDVLLGRTYAEAAGVAEPQEVSDDRYLATLSDIIRDLPTHGDVLIIGRGSQVILKDWPGALHVLLVAPLDHRLEEVARREGLTEEAAAKRVHDGDRGRTAFHDKFFKIAVDDPSLYHLTLNTAHVPIEEAAQIIGEVALRVQRGQP